MEFKNLQLEDVIVLEDKKRKPLSTMDRSKRKGIYPYYGAQEIKIWLKLLKESFG